MDMIEGLPLKYLRLESKQNSMNMTQVLIFQNQDAAAVAPSLETIKYACLQNIISTPLLRQRVVESPFHLANPVWIDDPHMDLNYHIIQKSIPYSASYLELFEFASTYGSKIFDRGSPLWKICLVTFDESQRFALVCVAHRSLLCRMELPLFDVMFPQDIEFIDEDKIETLKITCAQTGSTFGFNWLPESLPSRNELLDMAKSDWLAIPKQAKAFSSLMISRWAKRKIAHTIVDKTELPPEWVSAPHSIFNSRSSKNNSFGYIELNSHQSRKLLRQYKSYSIRDLVLTLISRTLQKFMDDVDHHTKDELVALIQSYSFSSEPCQMESEDCTHDYQLLRLPTNIDNPLEQLQAIVGRRHAAREFNQLFNDKTNINLMPSSFLSWFMSTYNKLGIHHFHKPICNLVISEQPAPQGAQVINQFNKIADIGFSSLFPHIGLHINYWVTKDSACIALTTDSPLFNAQHLLTFFEDSVHEFTHNLNMNHLARK